MRKNFFNYLRGRNLAKLFLGTLLLVLGTSAQAQTGTQSAGTIACPAPTATAPVWGELVLSGNVVTCYYATGTDTPTTWTQIGQPQTINFLNDPLLVGMFITASNGSRPGSVSTGTIDNFSITPAATYRLADCDIGAPQLMGSANLISGVWTMTGSGAGLSPRVAADQCNFQSWLVWGDCTVICRVTSLSTTGNAFQSLGIMVRDAFNSGSDYALFSSTNGAGVKFKCRHTFLNNPDSIQYVSPPAPGVVSSVSLGYGPTGGTIYTLRP